MNSQTTSVSPRQQVWKLLLDRGAHTPSAIAHVLGLSIDDVRPALRDLCEARFVQRETDGPRVAGEWRYEATSGPRFDEQLCDSRLAKIAQQRREQPEARVTPHASMPPGKHLPAPRRNRTPRPVRDCLSPRCRRVMLALRDMGPMTRNELARATTLPEGSVNARCDELLAAGYIIATGETRLTPHGSPAGVLALNPDKPYPF